jgi:tetratricopeptide (TPR) repeat protein
MRLSHTIAAIALAAGIVLLSVEPEDMFARGGGGRGGGGGGRPSGGGAARPAGGGASRPAGGNVSPGGGGGMNRSPGVSPPSTQRPSVQPGPGGGPGARSGPGVVTSPGPSPGTRPSVGVGTRPNIDSKAGPGKGINTGVGKGAVDPKFGVGKGPNGGVGKGPNGGVGKGPNGGAGKFPAYGDRPGVGQRPATLPGLGVGVGVGAGIAAGKAADNLGRRQEVSQNRQENIGDRSQNLEDRLGQRQDFRQQSQEDRQNFRNERSEDWQNWHNDYYGQHNGWYHGAWCDHWGDAWSHMWSEHTAAMVLGTTMWGLNRMSYWFGTSSYANPYYSEPLVVDNATISYAEPLAAPPVQEAAPPTATATLPPGVTPEGMKHFEGAQTAFYGGDYQQALTAVNKALASMPKDAVMHEFRALVLFALGKYHDAAETLHPVLAVGPGWDWTTMSSLYPDVDTYTKQLRALEEFARANPKAADVRFILAYHYLILGQDDAAAQQLQKVQQFIPNDTVSAQLLQMMGKATTKPAPAAESDVKIDPAQMVGAWTAARGDKARFELTLGKDKSFTWIYREGKNEQQVKGAYAIDGNVLALEPDAGGVMVAEVSAPQNGAFEFKTVGAPTTEPALKFQRK